MRKRLLAMVMTLVMVITMVPATVFAAEGGAASGIQLQEPIWNGDVSTWDCIYFGKYPQSSDGNAGFKTEPIKWRVLEVTDTDSDGIVDDAFLLSDKNLDAKPYNSSWSNITWENCTLRDWLNKGDFISKAFTPAEKTAIKDTVVDNNGTSGGAAGGKNTIDKVYLLSIDESRDAKYGFVSDQTRIAKNTAYATEKGAYTNGINGVGYWWLRSPGDPDSAAGVNSSGNVSDNGSGVSCSNRAARPALHLNLQSSCWSYVGTVNSNGTEITVITDATLSAENYAYTGGAITPTVVVKSGSDELVKDTDYTVAYSNNINPGTATITITGIGSYTGVISKSFTISAPATSNSPKVNVAGTNISKLTKAKKAFTVKWKKSTASNATGYQVRYSTKASMAGAKTKTIKGWKTTSKKITKLKAKKKYYVQVRAYKTVSGTNYYSDWSATKSVKTK